MISRTTFWFVVSGQKRRQVNIKSERQLWPEKREKWYLSTGNQRHFTRRRSNCGGRNTRPRTLRQSSGNLGDLKGEGSKQEQEHVSFSCVGGILKTWFSGKHFPVFGQRTREDVRRFFSRLKRYFGQLWGLGRDWEDFSSVKHVRPLSLSSSAPSLWSSSYCHRHHRCHHRHHHHLPQFLNSRYILEIIKYFSAGLNLCRNQLKTLLTNKSSSWRQISWQISNWSWDSTGASLLSVHGKEWKSWVKYFVSFQVSKYCTNIFTPVNMRWICSRCKILHEYLHTVKYEMNIFTL